MVEVIQCEEILVQVQGNVVFLKKKKKSVNLSSPKLFFKKSRKVFYLEIANSFHSSLVKQTSVKQDLFISLLQLLLKSTHILICKHHLHLESNFKLQKQSATDEGGEMLFHQEEKKHTSNKISSLGISQWLSMAQEVKHKPSLAFLHLGDHTHIVCVCKN